jgi:hypothetical protein
VTRKRLIILTLAVAISIALFIVSLGCSAAAPFDPCTVNPTRTTSTGQWVEADGEALDADPCDSDDFDSHGKPKVKKPTTKPATKSTNGGSRKSYK